MGSTHFKMYNESCERKKPSVQKVGISLGDITEYIIFMYF